MVTKSFHFSQTESKEQVLFSCDDAHEREKVLVNLYLNLTSQQQTFRHLKSRHAPCKCLVSSETGQTLSWCTYDISSSAPTIRVPSPISSWRETPGIEWSLQHRAERDHPLTSRFFAFINQTKVTFAFFEAILMIRVEFLSNLISESIRLCSPPLVYNQAQIGPYIFPIKQKFDRVSP